MFILLHEVKGNKVNQVLINTDHIEHIKASDSSDDTYVRMVKKTEQGSFFFVREKVIEIAALIKK
jgi:hypothetical protein